MLLEHMHVRNTKGKYSIPGIEGGNRCTLHCCADGYFVLKVAGHMSWGGRFTGSSYWPAHFYVFEGKLPESGQIASFKLLVSFPCTKKGVEAVR